MESTIPVCITRLLSQEQKVPSAGIQQLTWMLFFQKISISEFFCTIYQVKNVSHAWYGHLLLFKCDHVFFFYHGKKTHLCVSVDVSLFFTAFWNSNVKCLDIFHKRKKKSNNKKPNNFGKSSWLECFWGRKKFTEDYISKESDE